MRILSMMTLAVAVATGATTAAAQVSRSSRPFAPTSAEEQAAFDRATRDVFPSDVRRDPARHADTIVMWTGITDGSVDGTPFVEHHYFDGVVEGDGSVWLSPWGEGRFCLLGVPRDEAQRFEATRPLFVRAYGVPVVTDGGICLRDVTFVAGDRRYSMTVVEYGPNGQPLSSADAEERGAIRSYAEARLLTRLGYRVLVSAHTGSDTGWSASLELDLRLGLRTELALLAGPHADSGFGAPTSIQCAVLFRYHVVGVGAAFGPLVHVPVADAGTAWFGARYMPTVGDALGAWGVAPAVGGALDVAANADGDVRVLLQLSVGVDGNLGRPSRARR
jgi:hypothetical protein